MDYQTLEALRLDLRQTKRNVKGKIEPSDQDVIDRAYDFIKTIHREAEKQMLGTETLPVEEVEQLTKSDIEVEEPYKDIDPNGGQDSSDNQDGDQQSLENE